MTKALKSILFLKSDKRRSALPVKRSLIFPYEEARTLIKLALNEDDARNDVTSESLFSKNQRARAVIICKQSGVISGIPAAQLTFQMCGGKITFMPCAHDGEKIKKGDVLAKIEGRAASILAGERVALNFIQRLSGIATQTFMVAQKLKGLKAKLLDTRKTTPGMRLLEKYAVSCGGGINHRFSLSDGILIKDNHIRVCGDIKECVRRAVKTGKVVEIEVDTLTQLKQLLTMDRLPDIIMLDNMSLHEMREAVKLCRGKVRLEASGNVTLDTIRGIAKTGVDYISSGSLTHSAKALDISLDIIK